MKTLIIYKTKFGTTKQYVDWLAEDINADIADVAEYNPNMLENYELLVLSSGTYATRSPILKFIKKNWESLKNKKIVILLVGAVPWEKRISQRHFKGLPEEIRNNVKLFKVMGRTSEKDAHKVNRENLDPAIEHIRSL